MRRFFEALSSRRVESHLSHADSWRPLSTFAVFNAHPFQDCDSTSCPSFLYTLRVRLLRCYACSSSSSGVFGAHSRFRTREDYSSSQDFSTRSFQKAEEENESQTERIGNSSSLLTPVPFNKALVNRVHLTGRLLTDWTVKKVGPYDKAAAKLLICDPFDRTNRHGERHCRVWLNLWDPYIMRLAKRMGKGAIICVRGGLKVKELHKTDGTPFIMSQVTVYELALVADAHGVSPALTGDEGEHTLAEEGGAVATAAASRASLREELWTKFFEDPSAFWDNQEGKSNPRQPDFRHKDTREGLWIDDPNMPEWVKKGLQEMGITTIAHDN
eukprot:TRINITY_DN2310_c0_g1_i2.p1 TRINITY_DN2310_c0_g1~~TRINITY_DN2310_c0_g1_i2.p1  ORF type:complete len:328 (+),score=32.99 TRINITY_DN2310_c0_g1_i2:131-1114(+)